MTSRAFLITPFSAVRAGNEDPGIFETVQAAVRDAVGAAGVDLIHPAEIAEAGEIMQQVERDIERADFVLAILTGLNANVMLELGVAKKSAIIIIDTAEKLPFDVRHRRCLTYGGPGELATFAQRLEKAIRQTVGAVLRGRAESLSLRSSFAGLIAEHATRFGGRDAELVQLQNACRDPAKRYVLLTAPPGFGKTALLAALVSNDPDMCAYHFFSPTHVPESVAEDFFLRNAVQQMASWHGANIEPPRLLPEIRTRFRSLASTPLESPRVLVLDGVDEITTWRLDAYLPPVPPAGVTIVVSAREDGRDWIEILGLRKETTERMSLRGLSRESVVAVLRSAGGQATTLGADAPVIDRIVDVAKSPLDSLGYADPLYVHFLAEDAAMGKLTSESIGSIPRGFSAYLDALWLDIRAVAGDAPTRDLFGTLAVAIGPISRGDLEAINPSLVDGWAADLFDQVIERARRFIAGDQASGYSVMHPRLRIDLQTRIRTATYGDKLLAYCARWAETSSPYALRYLPSHLQEMGRDEALVELGRNQEFYDKVRHILPLELKLPLRTAQLALRAAVAADSNPTVAELLLLHAREAHAISVLASPVELARQGRVENAWHVMDVLDVHLAVLWHLLIAWDLRERGHIDLARDTLTRLSRLPLPSFAGWNLDDFVPVLVEVALLDEEVFVQLLPILVPDDYVARVTVLERLCEKGLWQFAVRCACENPDEAARLHAFGAILEVTPPTASGVVEAIERAIPSIQDVAIQACALARIGQRRGQIEGTDVATPYFDRAHAMLTESVTGTAAVYPLARVALREARAGAAGRALEHAREAAEGAEAFDEIERETYAAPLANIFAEAGDPAAAEQMAESVTDPQERDTAFAAVAAALAARGYVATARRIIARIVDPLGRVSSFASEAAARGDANELEAGRELFELAFADAARFEVDTARALGRLFASSYLQRNPEFAAAVLIRLNDMFPGAGRIDDAWWYVSLAHAQRSAGSADSAIVALDQALDAAWRQAPEVLPEELVSALCQAALACDRPDLVVRFAERLKSLRDTSWEDGNFDRAFDLDGRLEEMAAILADATEFVHAMRIAEWVRQERAQARAFARIAARQVGRGDREARAAYTRALQTYQRHVHDTDAKIAQQTIEEIQGKIVWDSRQRGDHQRSLAMSRRIQGDSQRVQNLVAGALMLASADPPLPARDVFQEAAAVARAVPDSWSQEFPNKEPPWRFAGTARVTVYPNAVAPGPLLALVAGGLQQAGSAEEARALLSEALNVTERTPSPWRRKTGLDMVKQMTSDIPELAAHLQALAPQLSQATGVMDDAEPRQPDSSSLEDSIESLLRERQFESALGLALAVEDLEEKDGFLASIAEVQSENGLFGDAKDTIAKLSTVPSRGQALATVAEAAGRAGAVDDALRMTEEAQALFELKPPDDDEERDGFSGALVAAWAAGREFSRALTTADTIRDQTLADDARIKVACELARAGNAPEAVALAQRVLVDPERAALLVATELVESGDRKQFRELILACAYRMNTAYRACGLLARADPASAEQIFAVLGENALVVSGQRTGTA